MIISKLVGKIKEVKVTVRYTMSYPRDGKHFGSVFIPDVGRGTSQMLLSIHP
jgi:hypothetical protein